jgi:capsule polysaccharide export protein KpsE/RkpR
MEEIQSPLSTTLEEFSPLDILVTLVENLKLLILGPLLVGLCALAIGFAWPKTYESVAVLQSEQFPASLMTTAAVLDPVIVSLGLAKDETVEDARSRLREQIKAVTGRTDKLLTLTVSAGTAEHAQALANALLQQAYKESRPRANARLRLETQLAEAQTRLKNAQTAAASLARRLESSAAITSGNDPGRGYAELLNTASEAQKQLSALEAQLEGLISPAQLIQAPTLPQKASKPKKTLLAIGATLATGLLLVLFVFMRQIAVKTAANTRAAEKLARIRRSLGRK